MNEEIWHTKTWKTVVSKTDSSLEELVKANKIALRKLRLGIDEASTELPNLLLEVDRY